MIECFICADKAIPQMTVTGPYTEDNKTRYFCSLDCFFRWCNLVMDQVNRGGRGFRKIDWDTSAHCRKLVKLE